MSVSNNLLGVLVFILLLSANNPLAAQQRIAFVTSATGNGNLGSWIEAGDGLTGLAAADSVCVAQATAANLANPQNFTAWMSDSNDDAYCRVHGLSGKKASNCGEVSLPVAAGPWLRTDGQPWAGSIDQIINSFVVYNPALLDESGVTLPLDHKAWLSTLFDGTFQGNSCSDWTDSSGTFGYTLPLQFTSWYGDGGASCGADNVHLLCLETGAGPAVELQEPDGNIAFISSATGTGNLSAWDDAEPGTIGMEAGDSICNALAAAADLPFQGQYKAWLSDDLADARDRFENDGPWDRLDGFRIAHSLEDLTDGVLATASQLTEQGEYFNNRAVWTGTLPDGTAATLNCGNWEAGDDAQARVGRSNHTTAGWTDLEGAFCFNDFFHLQCLSDADLSPKRVFVSSAKGTADISSWPQATEGLEGLAAADSVCISLATDAELENPQSYVAWLSDSENDLWCRVQNLSGIVSNNCGLDELPMAAGPWVRTDGTPGWASLTDMASPSTAFSIPILVDENGLAVSPNENAWSATNENGTAQDISFTCGDWTIDNAGSGRVLPLNFNGWYANSNTPCSNTTGHLICAETGQALKLDLPPPSGNIIFVSSVAGNGDLETWDEAEPGVSGIEAGDSICNNLAEQAGLPFQGSYKAWLSDDSVAAAERFEQRGGWQRPDGIEVASTLADLTDGQLFASVIQDETGEYQVNNDIWTGTNTNGSASGFDCENWSSAEEGNSGITGRNRNTIASWTAFTTRQCSQTSTHLYCLSDVELVYIFEDGFESP